MSEESVSGSRERSVQEFLEAVRANPEIQSKLQTAEDPGDVIMIARSFGFYGFRPLDLPVDGKGCLIRALSQAVEEPGSCIELTMADAKSAQADCAELPQSEALDAVYISNYGIEEFNAALLLSPLEISENKFLSLMEQNDKTMPLLCPVAKALYYLKRSELRDYLADGLDNVIIADPRIAAKPSREEVVHIVTKSLGENKISLEFRSTAEFIWADSDCDDSSDTGLAIGSLRDWMPNPGVKLSKDDFIAWLKEISSNSEIQPLGDPVDEGSFVCSLTYRLSAVNEMPVKSRVEILYSAHELQFSKCDKAKENEIVDSANAKFSWMTLLSKSELARFLRKETWLSNESLSSLDHPDTRGILSISVDEIHQSYKSASVKRKSAKHLYLLIGSGSRWKPGFERATEEECQADAQLREMLFPPTHPPLQIYRVTLGGKNLAYDGLDECFCIIEELAKAATSMS